MAEVDLLRALMKKFANVPMSLADACLVIMTELDRTSVVVTLDSDFRIYRHNRRRLSYNLAQKGRRLTGSKQLQLPVLSLAAARWYRCLALAAAFMGWFL